ncbi:MAG: hypothetical protein ACYC0V_02175 [Armatimonadota bacterium]
MPFCPVCKYEYEDGVCRCPDCDVDLVDQLQDEELEIPVASADDELTYALLSDKPLETSVLKDKSDRLGRSVFSSPVMIVIVGVIVTCVLLPILFIFLNMIGIQFGHFTSPMLMQIIGFANIVIPIFIMGLVMGKFAPQRSVRTAFLTGLVMTLSISAMGTLIMLLIPHRGMGTYTSQAWALHVLGLIACHVGLAGIFLAGFLLSRKRNFRLNEGMINRI